MTESLDRARRALSGHGAFAADGDGFEVTTTALDARVTVEDAEDAVAYRVTVRAPSIDAVVVGESVGETVREGWFETFERRLKAVGGVTTAEPATPTVRRAGEAVVVETGVETDAPGRGADDAKALVDFVEGTYLQGAIPGYDYRDPMAGLLDRAGERSDSEGPPL